ncbi:MAG: phosphoglucosamine mutase [Gammaproteobacteria bacterium]|nr:phosphoglucosamine mutase [Gammaproteobacteria bacterium]
MKFGTDGVRGRVGVEPMTASNMLALGQAAGRVLAANAKDGQGGIKRRVLIGKDTRVSGYMIESALEAGLIAAGVDVRLLGPLPTPAIAYLTRTFRASAGIVISASHNPYYDNGIKFFGPDGRKLDDETEAAIEAAVREGLRTNGSDSLGQAKRVDDAAGRYIEFCKSTYPADCSLQGVHIALDCAHGAAYMCGPKVFEELGAKVTLMGAEPNGVNINAGVGSTEPAALAQLVKECGADVGIAFDGDADRLQMVTAEGNLVDGDQLLFIAACERQRLGELQGPVVGTIMSNLGLENAITEKGMEFIRADVGDRYVMAELKARGGVIGGETSGHMLCLDKTTTGDAIIAALDVLSVMCRHEKSLAELAAGMPQYPQQTTNVDVENAPFDKADIASQPAVQKAKADAEQALGKQGRIILRPSGTQPVVRVTVEAQTQALVDQHLPTLVAAVEAAAG